MRRTLVLALLVLPAAARAHTGDDFSGIVPGLLHPLTGTDHVLAMLAVGLWAALAGGAARLAYLAAFLAGMLAGAGSGLAGSPPPGIEPMILASVIVIGAAVALAAQARIGLACGVLALFGLAHGAAHGVEATGDGLGFVAGVFAATAALHATGLGAGLWLRALRVPGVVRALGALTAAGGSALAFG